MKQHPALPIIENVLAESLALKARVERRKLRLDISRKVFDRQEKLLHERIVSALAPLFEEQIRETAERLLELAPGEKHLQGRHNQLTHGRGSGGSGEGRKSPINESKQKVVQDALGMVNDRTISLMEENGIRIVDSDRADVGRASYLKYQGVIAVRKGGIRHSIYSEDRAAEPIDVVHEMGHAVDAALSSKIPVSERTFDQHAYWSEKGLSSTLRADEKAMKPKKPGPSWEDPVGSWSYAYGSPEEAFSACFAAVHGNDERHNGFSIQDAMPKTYAAVAKKLKSNGISPRKHVSGDNKKHLSSDLLIDTGFDPTKTKHLQGRHNQLTHGRGGGGSQQEWKESLSSEEMKAVEKWGGWGVSGDIRRMEVGMLPKEGTSEEMLDAFHSAIDRAPDWNGVMYRGLANLSPPVAEQFKTVGNEITFEASASCSKRQGLAYRFIGDALSPTKPGNEDIVLAIKAKTGADFSDIGDKMGPSRVLKEVVARRGSRYRVISAELEKTESELRGWPVWEVELEEI